MFFRYKGNINIGNEETEFILPGGFMKKFLHKKTRNITIFFSLLLFIFFSSGCSSGINLGKKSPGTGSFSISVSWPGSNLPRSVRFIPSSASKIKVSIYAPGMPALVTSAEAQRGVSNITINDIPAGNKVALVQALDDENRVCSQRRVPFIIYNNTTTNAGEVPLGVAVTGPSSCPVFEPSVFTVVQGQNVYFQNWTDADFTCRMTIKGAERDVFLVKSGFSPTGLPIYSQGCFQPNGACLFTLVENTSATGQVNGIVAYNYVPVTKWGKNNGSGASGTGNGEFSFITGIVMDSSGGVYVVERSNHRVQKFALAPDGLTLNFITKWGKNNGSGSAGAVGSGNGEFNQPMGAALDSSGNLYVADCYNHRVQKFNMGAGYTPVFITKWGKNCGDGSSGTDNGEFYYPNSIVITPAGRVVVIEDGAGILQLFSSDGAFITKWGKNNGSGQNGAGNGEFMGAICGATDPDGNFFTLEYANNRVQKFTFSPGENTLNFITKWGRNNGAGQNGTGNGEFYTPVGIKTDRFGNVYVGDSNNHRMQKFCPNSVGTGYDFVTKWGKAGNLSGNGNGEFNHIAHIETDYFGNIYVVDSSNNRIQKFQPVPP